MPKRQQIRQILTEFKTQAPSGFAIGLHISYAAPALMLQTYPRKWGVIYTEHNLMVNDPTVRWAMKYTGAVRWSETGEPDPANVMSQAAEFGMRYGSVISVASEGTRSAGFFSRSDRDFTDEEMATQVDVMQQLHAISDPSLQNDEAFLKDVRNLSILLTHP